MALGSRDTVRPRAGRRLPPPHHWARMGDASSCAGSPGDNVTPWTQPEPRESPKGMGLWGLRLAPVCPEPSQLARGWESMGLARGSASPSLGFLPVVTSYASAVQRPPVLSGCSTAEAAQGTVCEQTSGQSLAAAKESNQRSKGEQHRAAGPGQSPSGRDAPCHWEPGRRAGQDRQECSPCCLHLSCHASLLPCPPPVSHPSCPAHTEELRWQQVTGSWAVMALQFSCRSAAASRGSMSLHPAGTACTTVPLAGTAQPGGICKPAAVGPGSRSRAQARQGAAAGTRDAIEHLANGFPAWIRAGGACWGAGGTCLHGVGAAGWCLSCSNEVHPRRQQGENQFCVGST